MSGHLKERFPDHWAVVLDVGHRGTGETQVHSFSGTKGIGYAGPVAVRPLDAKFRFNDYRIVFQQFEAQ
jgi:hypothetical protein